MTWLSPATVIQTFQFLVDMSRCPDDVLHARNSSAVPTREVAHEIYQRLHGFERHRVVQRGAHAADRLVTFERQQAGSFGFLQKRRIECARGSVNGTFMRERAVVDRVAIETARAVDIPVQQLGLRAIALADRGEATLCQQPLENRARPDTSRTCSAC